MRFFTLVAICLPVWTLAQAPAPVFSSQAGFYSGLMSIELTASSDYDIRYTTNGDSVSQYSTLYHQALKFSSTTVLRARCYPHGMFVQAGPIVTQSYIINENLQLPVLSITMATYHLWDINVGIYVEGDQIDTCNFYPYPCANYWQGWVKPAYVEYFGQDKQLKVAQNAGIEITGGWSKANPKKGFLLQFDHDDYGDGKVKDWPLMPDKPTVTTWKNLHVRPGGNGLHSQFGHDAWIQKAMKETHNDYIAYQAAHVFLNGQYWGVYELREREDKHFIRYNYGVDKDSVDVIRFPESSNFYGISNYYAVQAGSDSIWKQTVRRMHDANPKDAGFYGLIDAEFDLDNYIDYFAVQTFIGNNDWLGPWFNNIRVWRPQTLTGKWRYMLWDLDGSMGEQWDDRYTPCFDNIQYARHPDGWVIEHSWMFDKMCQNPQFQEQFARRYVDLLNTVLSPAHLTEVANEIRDGVEPDIIRNFLRWGGSKSFWRQQFELNIEWARQRRACAANQVAKALSLKGSVALSLEMQPAAAGRASVGIVTDIVAPWYGIFFKDYSVSVGVEPEEGWIFSHWESDGDPLAQPDSAHFEHQFTQYTKLTAYFIPKVNVAGFSDGAVLYPNPATDWVFVQSEKALGLCTLRDALGRFVSTFQTANTYARFNVEGLPAGLYTLHADTWVRKIVVSHALVH